MLKNLVIVESPAKAKTIEKILGSDYRVVSSFGHVRDLPNKGINIDFEHDYRPRYEVPSDKKELVNSLKKEAKKAEVVWLASDEDREGEAIAWHLYEVLGLKPENTRRIVFHEITPSAILDSIEHPRDIDPNLVNAQQARRVLDRIVGFELSPVLWRKVKPSLSAGRVQSVAVRLIVEREREIQHFTSEATYRVTAAFSSLDEQGRPVELRAELDTRFATREEAVAFLQTCGNAHFTVEDMVTRPTQKSPVPPFTTSTLQQEAARKLGFSVSQTMMVAQRLYEAGKITYMRTDSVNLSELALRAAKKEITSMAGEHYVQTRRFTTRSKGAQEAHEAIRPTYMDARTVSGTDNEKRLYELVWKRTIASQMADAKLEKTTLTIGVEGSKHRFVATGEVIVFDGFLRVYQESTDEAKEGENSSMLPAMEKGQSLEAEEIIARQHFTRHPPRYTEAGLVRKMEELGIGRPSTYAPTISTIQNRKYVVKDNLPEKKRECNQLTLHRGKLTEKNVTENYGGERNKLFPTDIGIVVNDFLTEHFPDILSYNFTAELEKEFDGIAEGKEEWVNSIDRFYKNFHPQVESTLQNSEQKVGERILGIDPKTGRRLSVKIGRYGPCAQIGTADEPEKPLFASLQKNQSIESITLEEALKLFELPRSLGSFEDAEMTVGVGRFGPYVRHANKYYSLAKTDDPSTVTPERAKEIILAKREEDKKRLIRSFGSDGEIAVLNGRFGPYIACKGKNYKIPKDTDPALLTEDDVRRLMENASESGAKKKRTTRKKSRQ